MAAGATYEPLATTTLGSAASSITFSSIPSTYTDLRIVFVFKNNAAGIIYPGIQFNSDTGTNYSSTILYGNGTSAASTYSTNYTSLWRNVEYTTDAYPSLYTLDIFSYAGSTYKTALTSKNSDNNGSGAVVREVGLWRSTAAINSISIVDNGVRQFAAGTTATIWGIKAA